MQVKNILFFRPVSLYFFAVSFQFFVMAKNGSNMEKGCLDRSVICRSDFRILILRDLKPAEQETIGQPRHII